MDETQMPHMFVSRYTEAPGIIDKGIRTSALVELIDLCPSITELAGLEVAAPRKTTKSLHV